jgi:aminoglycoside phosphotransferase (APT) family kinase protein
MDGAGSPQLASRLMRPKLHADEIDIDDDLVRRLLREQFPQWAELPLEPIASSGTVNVVYRLGRGMLVRLPRVMWGVDDVYREQVWLPRLAPHLPIAVPTLLGAGAPGAGYPCPWSVFDWLDGHNPTLGELQAPELLARDLTRFVQDLRQVGTDGAPKAYRGGPLVPLDAVVRQAITQLRDKIDTAAATTAWDDALRAPDWPRPPVWVHADLVPGNLLLEDGRLSAVIDFAAAGIGDPACDLMPVWGTLPATVRAAVRDDLDVDDATWTRGRGWTLAQALIALPYYEHTNPVMAANARHAIHEVLDEAKPA